MTTALAPAAPPPASRSIRRIEHHLGTAITLAATGIDDETADRFFQAIEASESLLSRFRPNSELSRVAAGRLSLDDAAPALREVLAQCEHLRELTRGAFEFEPRRHGDPQRASALDPNALAKGWIIDQAALVLRLRGAREFFVSAGGDVVVSRAKNGHPWRVGIQHPYEIGAIVGTMALTSGAVATSGTYCRGDHIRMGDRPPTLASVTVVGPELYMADALATAVFSSSRHDPDWWGDVHQSYGLLTLDHANTLRWKPPTHRHGDGRDVSFKTA